MLTDQALMNANEDTLDRPYRLKFKGELEAASLARATILTELKEYNKMQGVDYS
jgi:hypothetical protein